MSFSIKPWFNRIGSGTDLDAPDVDSVTLIDAAGMRDLELRLAAYTGAVVQDPVTGWPPRGTGQPRPWIGWTDPTDLMSEYDWYFSVPAP